jgi:hypothetical protein
MPWLFIASTALCLLCLLTAFLDFWMNGFAAEWGPTGLMMGFMLALVAWATHP